LKIKIKADRGATFPCYVTVFMNLVRKERPVLFVTEGKAKETIRAFLRYFEDHKGEAGDIARVVCDMSKALCRVVKSNSKMP